MSGLAFCQEDNGFANLGEHQLHANESIQVRILQMVHNVTNGPIIMAWCSLLPFVEPLEGYSKDSRKPLEIVWHTLTIDMGEHEPYFFFSA